MAQTVADWHIMLSESILQMLLILWLYKLSYPYVPMI